MIMGQWYMRRLWQIAFFACALFGCSKEDPVQPEPQAIILECTDDSLAGTPKADWINIIRVYPDNQFQTALHYFMFDEKRFTQPCITSGRECSLTVTSRFITEVGRWPNVPGSSTVEINRTTGKITETIDYGVGPSMPNKVTTGMCKPGAAPEEASTKF